jgi:hypothetical protein
MSAPVMVMRSPESESVRTGAGGKRLRVSEPDDAFEHEADRVADIVASGGRVPAWSLSPSGAGVIRRDSVTAHDVAQATPPAPLKPDNYGDAVGPTLDAFMQTSVGRRILQVVTEGRDFKAVTDFAQTPAGIVIGGSAAVGTIAALAAAGKPLPLQLPALPLDKYVPGLKVKFTYEGPVNRPTSGMVTLTFGAPPAKKRPGQDSGAYRAETARIAAEQAGLLVQRPKGPAGASTEPGSDGVPAPGQFAPLMPQSPPMSLHMREPGLSTGSTGIKPPRLIDKPLELQPMQPPAAERADKTEETPVQRKADGQPQVLPDATSEVDAVLRSPGRPLDEPTRRLMSSRIGFDFGKVRIHTDDRAAASAKALGARAYTIGTDVVFGSGRYAPDTAAGRRLLAHELTHVVQQSPQGASSGLVARRGPVRIQRDVDRKAAAADAAEDDMNALVYSTVYASVESDPPDVLIEYATKLSAKYDAAQASASTPLTRLALASALSRIHSTLLSDQSTAERDADGALLAPGVTDPVPWSKERPHAVGDMPLFSPEHVIAWQADAAANEHERSLRARARKGDKPDGERPKPPPRFAELTAHVGDAGGSPEAAKAQTKPVVADAPKIAVQPRTRDELDAEGEQGGGSVIRRGLAALSAATLSSSVYAGLGITADVSKGRSVLDACAQIWFLSNRMYLLDRTGHLMPRDEAWFDISGVGGLRPGGVYFLRPGDERIGEKQFNFRFAVVAGPGTETIVGEIKFQPTMTALKHVLDLNQELARDNVGVGLIIDPTFGQRRQTFRDISAMKLRQALVRVPDVFPRAVFIEYRRVKRDFAEEALNHGMALVNGYVSQLLKFVGTAQGLVQNMELVTWLGDVLNVAAYAQTDDEIDLAAQAIARKLAQFLIFDLIHRAGKLAVRAGAAGVAKLKARSGGREPAPDVRLTSADDTRPADHHDAASAATAQTDVDAHPKGDAGRHEHAAPVDSDAHPAPGAKAAEDAAGAASPADATTPAPHAEPAFDEASHQASKGEHAAPETAATESATPGEAATASQGHAIDDVLSGDRKKIAAKDPAVRKQFTPKEAEALDRLQAAYERYVKRMGDKAKEPAEWLRAVKTGRPRKDAKALFGEGYARRKKAGATSKGAASEGAVPLENHPRPGEYSEDRLKADLATAEADPSTWARLPKVRDVGLFGGKVDRGIWNILLGNLGEILARPIMNARLAKVQARFKGARLEWNTRVARRRPDGTFEAPKLFSDGLIVSENNGQIELHDAFEVKAGKAGGQEATSQFFMWREKLLQPGDQLVLQDGRRFTYAPGKDRPGQIVGMMTATPHIIAARGAEHLGEDSGDQVGETGTRTALAHTPQEIAYLARVLLETLPNTPEPGNAPGTAPAGGHKP